MAIRKAQKRKERTGRVFSSEEPDPVSLTLGYLMKPVEFPNNKVGVKLCRYFPVNESVWLFATSP